MLSRTQPAGNCRSNGPISNTLPLESANRQAIVIYDAVPGGAGHSRQIRDNIPAIVQRARDLLESCDCDRESTGCYGCLCDHQNQFAHDQLSRGGALEFLDELAETLESGKTPPWREPYAVPVREMADSIRAATGPVRVIARSLAPEPIPATSRD